MKTESDDSDRKEGQADMLKRIDLTRDFQKHKEEYLKANLGEMRKLKLEIDTYCEALELPEQEEYEDFSNEEFNEDYY